MLAHDWRKARGSILDAIGHRIDRCPDADHVIRGLRNPGPRLAQPEVSALHRLGKQRSIVQEVGIDGEVAVSSRAWDGDVRLADTQVDRLGPDEPQCLEVSLKGGERVEQGTTGGDRFLSFARHLRSSSST